MQRRVLYIALVMLASCISARSQQVTITPEMPQRGETVSVVFTPLKASEDTKEQISAKDSLVTLVFTFSNLYDVPYRLPMKRSGDQWTASFALARYATYATFTLESGNKVQKPAKDRHYALPVFENGKRIFSGYLYESYSLPAQMGKDSKVPALQAALLQKELEIHPDNYEARVRLLHNKMNGATTPEEKEKFRKQALEVIAANFYSNPGNMGLMNKTTMGYLIIGEKTRVDSIRDVVRKNYPNTEAGYEMRVDDIRDIADKEERKEAAELMIKNTPAKDAKYISDLHEVLMEYYAEKHIVPKVLAHYTQLVPDTSPYRGEVWLKRAQMFLKNGILLDTAEALTNRAFAVAPSFPAGLIRYFPETGHILPYVDPQTKKQVEQAARGASLSLQALVQYKRGDKQKATETLDRALSFSSDAKTLANAGAFYRASGQLEKSYPLMKKLVMEKQEDTAAQRLMKEDYLAWKKSEDGWEREMGEVTDVWRTRILAILKKERMNKKSPGIDKLVNIKGEPVPASALAGKIVVIDFWATWCVPCMKEMPYVEAVYKKYKNDPRVMFMVVNSGSANTLADAQGWSGNKTYSFPVYYTNEKSLGEKFGFSVIPTTLVIDGNGNIQFRNIGFEGPVIEHKLGMAIEMLLGETSQARL